MRLRDRRAGSDAPRGAADDARGHPPAAVRAQPCVPARRRVAAAGHRPVTAAADGAAPDMTEPVALRSAVVIGTGLIGTSVALALRECGMRVWLSDRDPSAARLA